MQRFFATTATLLCLTLFALTGCGIPPAEKQRRLNDYFRQANQNVSALECNQYIYKRHLTAKQKQWVINRDGRRCIICGSKKQLEVDHKRAIMNGGSNAPENLGTLCDDCHTLKTRMDNTLRQKRDLLCCKPPQP